MVARILCCSVFCLLSSGSSVLHPQGWLPCRCMWLPGSCSASLAVGEAQWRGFLRAAQPHLGFLWHCGFSCHLAGVTLGSGPWSLLWSPVATAPVTGPSSSLVSFPARHLGNYVFTWGCHGESKLSVFLDSQYGSHRDIAVPKMGQPSPT